MESEMAFACCYPKPTPMTPASSPRPSTVFWEVRDGTFIVMVRPFALLFGVVAAGSACPWGNAGFLGAGDRWCRPVCRLLDAGAPVSVAVGTGLAVNLRMALYSASLVPYLGRAPLRHRAWVAYTLVDQVYALALLRFQGRRNPRPLGWATTPAPPRRSAGYGFWPAPSGPRPKHGSGGAGTRLPCP